MWSVKTSPNVIRTVGTQRGHANVATRPCMNPLRETSRGTEAMEASALQHARSSQIHAEPHRRVRRARTSCNVSQTVTNSIQHVQGCKGAAATTTGRLPPTGSARLYVGCALKPHWRLRAHVPGLARCSIRQLQLKQMPHLSSGNRLHI